MQIFRIQISTHFHLSTFCAWVSDYGYIFQDPIHVLITSWDFWEFFIFFGQNVISNISLEFYINWIAKPNQISIPPSEVFDGSLVKLVIVSAWRASRVFFQVINTYLSNSISQKPRPSMFIIVEYMKQCHLLVFY